MNPSHNNIKQIRRELKEAEFSLHIAVDRVSTLLRIRNMLLVQLSED